MKDKRKRFDPTIRPRASDGAAVASAPGGIQPGTLRSSAESVSEHKDDKQQASSSLTDAELLRCIAADDRRAFEILYLRHRQGLLNFVVWKYQLDEQTAEDVLSDVFLRFFQRRHNLRITGDVLSYLMSMARNTVADRCKRQIAAGKELSADMQASDLSPHAAVEQDEIAGQVAQAVDSLAESHRLALELKQAGYSTKEIAAIVNCTEKAAQRRLEKARVQLRLALSRCGPSCVIGTPRQDQCPARAKELYCLKWLFFKNLRSQHKKTGDSSRGNSGHFSRL